MTVAFDPQALLARRFDEVVNSYTRRDAMLYALGLGLGANPLDPAELRFTYEKGLETFPTMAVVLGHPGPWMTDPATGIDFGKVLHAEQHLEIHRPLPVECTTVSTNRVYEVIDKGAATGAILCLERKVHDQASGELLSTQRSLALARANGGQGGTGSGSRPAPLPERPADFSIDIPIACNAALLYRLSGDYNPLHADPALAAKAGFQAPILHGLASYGIAARAVIAACCPQEPQRLRRLGVRFSSVVYPGETLRTEIWRDGAEVAFRSLVVGRELVALNNGQARIE